MARYTCERCKADCNTLDPPHLCRDVAARLRRRARQADAVIEVHLEHSADPMSRTEAEAIVERLARLGVEGD